MKKIIELLNKFEKEKIINDGGYVDEDIEYFGRSVEDGEIVNWSYDPDAHGFFKYYIISKDFKFIERLVENDKIDKKKFEDNFFVCGCCGYKLLSTRETCEACGDEVLDIYEALLMRLAIQYEPLKFLISILK